MFDKLLDELYALCEKEADGIKLSKDETERYVHVVETLQNNDIEIPFGIEI